MYVPHSFNSFHCCGYLLSKFRRAASGSGDPVVRAPRFGTDVRGSNPPPCKFFFCLPRPPRSLAPVAVPRANVPSLGSSHSLAPIAKRRVEPADVAPSRSHGSVTRSSHTPSRRRSLDFGVSFRYRNGRGPFCLSFKPRLAGHRFEKC